MILKQILSALLNLDDLQALCTSAAVQLIYELVQLKIARVGSAAELVRITYEDVAQSVEHTTFNRSGEGSIPSILTTYSHLQQLFSGSM